MESVLPPSCRLCGTPIDKGMLCLPCHQMLPILTQPVCPRCAIPVSGAGETCGRCQRHPPDFDSTVALFTYDFPVDGLVIGLKYGQSLQAANFFAEGLAQRLEKSSEMPDRIIPMPLHPRRLRLRGFNQAVEIARPLSHLIGCRMDIKVLVRDTDTPPQVGRSWAERTSNVRGAFRCLVDLTGLRIAVVDDVMTTGATLNEVARCLKGRGAVQVDNWIVARTL